MNTTSEEVLWDRMIREQIEARGIRDPEVTRAMRTIPRSAFVPEGREAAAYDDAPLPIGFGQTISQPYMVALMTELLELTGTERALDVGTGSGYQAAILSQLAASVVSIERIPELAEQARSRLARLGIANVDIIVGDGTLGLNDSAGFDAIVVGAGSPEVPEPLVAQLLPGGRMVIPVGGDHVQTLTLIRRGYNDQVRTTTHGSCVFVPLVGVHGWRA